MTRRTENSKVVRDLREEIRDVEDALATESQSVRQRNIEKAQGELTMAKARVASLRRQLDQADGNITSLEKRTLDLNGLKREVSEDEENYRTYARKLEESLIMDDMDRRKMVAISVIEKAVPARTPKQNRLNKQNLAAGGFFGGIAGGIVFALFLEFMAPGMTTPLSAEKRLGLPVMIAVANKGNRG